MTYSLTVQSAFDRWNQIKAEQGFIGKAWNGIKEFTNLGQSESDCESMLQAYKDHKISLTEAMEYIESFEKKQENATNLIANIATGIASIVVATTAAAGGPIGWVLAFKKGAPIGAAVKTALKTLDRATNEIEGDELDVKTIAKDAISGALTGTTSAVSSGIFQGVKEAKNTKTVLEGLKTSVANGAKCGAKCGLISGAVDYTTDAALDKDKRFDLDEMANASLKSGMLSASVGAAFGGGIFGVEGAAGNLGTDVSTSILEDSFLSSSRKFVGNKLSNMTAKAKA